MSEFTPKEMKATLQPRRPGEMLKVAQTVLKRRDRNLKAAADRAAKIAKGRDRMKTIKKGGKFKVVRAERLIKDKLIMLKDLRRLKNKDKKPVKKLQKGRTLLVARNNRKGGSKITKLMLKDLRLTKKNTVVFLSNTDEVVRRLQTVKPFVFWGVPSFKIVTNLVHKKAMFKDPAKPRIKQLLSDNTIIENCLGDLGVLCTEDLAHVINTRSEHFDKVTEKLWPIKLGDIMKANGMIQDRRFTYGDVKKTISSKVEKLLAE